MPIQVLKIAAWIAENVAVPVLEWALSKAYGAMKRHEQARTKKKGAPPAETGSTP